jgi:hypothetical protein
LKKARPFSSLVILMRVKIRNGEEIKMVRQMEIVRETEKVRVGDENSRKKMEI